MDLVCCFLQPHSAKLLSFYSSLPCSLHSTHSCLLLFLKPNRLSPNARPYSSDPSALNALPSGTCLVDFFFFFHFLRIFAQTFSLNQVYHDYLQPGVPGGLSQVNIWLLISAHVLISESWVQAPHWVPCWMWSLFKKQTKKNLHQTPTYSCSSFPNQHFQSPSLLYFTFIHTLMDITYHLSNFKAFCFFPPIVYCLSLPSPNRI